MKRVVKSIVWHRGGQTLNGRGVVSGLLRQTAVALLLLTGLAGAASAAAPTSAAAAEAPSQQAAPSQDVPAGTAVPRAGDESGAVANGAPQMLGQAPAVASSSQQLAQMDLSVWGMYQHADIVVKTVMIGLLLASVVTWALFFGKSAELSSAKRRLRRELKTLREARSLDGAIEAAAAFSPASVSAAMIAEMQNELELSADSQDSNGIKERASFRLERRVAATGRAMGKGNGFLATIGAISPFIGLFGTVWGIMNSFIGIAHTQTTNLAVVAPGIAEALLATAVGLFAAIPAVVIYNVFARTIAGYRTMVGDSAAQILLLLGRDLDLAASASSRNERSVAKFRIG